MMIKRHINVKFWIAFIILLAGVGALGYGIAELFDLTYFEGLLCSLVIYVCGEEAAGIAEE